MCCYRNYLYPSHGRFLGLNAYTPLEIPVKRHTFLLKLWLLRPPTPLEFPLTFHRVGMDLFWNSTIWNTTKTFFYQLTGNMSDVHLLLVQDWPIQKTLYDCHKLCSNKTREQRKWCVDEPLLSIAFNHVLVDILHLFLRIMGAAISSGIFLYFFIAASLYPNFVAWSN